MLTQASRRLFFVFSKRYFFLPLPPQGAPLQGAQLGAAAG